MVRFVGGSGRLVALTALSLATMLPGCCTFKGWFGMLGYNVGVVASSDVNYGSSSDVLLVWPSAEKAAELENAGFLSKARELAKQWKLQGLCEYADLDNFSGGDYDGPLDSWKINEVQTESLRMFCPGDRLFVWTTIEDPNADPSKGGDLHYSFALNDPTRPFTKYILIHLQRTDFDVEFLPTYVDLEIRCQKPYE